METEREGRRTKPLPPPPAVDPRAVTLTSAEVIALLRFRSLSSLYERLDPKHARYDPRLPRPIRIGDVLRWRLSELIAYEDQLAAERDAS